MIEQIIIQNDKSIRDAKIDRMLYQGRNHSKVNM